MINIICSSYFPFPCVSCMKRLLIVKKKSLSNSQDAKLRLLKNKTAGGKLQFCHYNVQHVVWALEVKLELGWRFWVSRHAYSRFVPRPALFAVRSTNWRECRVWNTNSIILAPWAFGAWRDFLGYIIQSHVANLCYSVTSVSAFSGNFFRCTNTFKLLPPQ